MDTTDRVDDDGWADGWADGWVDEKMAALAPSDAWQPDTAQGVTRFRARQAAHRARAQRWAVAGVGVAAVTLALPATRTFATRCVDACVARVNDLLQPDRASVSLMPTGFAAVDAREPAPDFTVTDADGR